MKRVNYYLTDKQYESLKNLSEETELSVSELIRRAVDLFLAVEEDERKWDEQFADPRTEQALGRLADEAMGAHERGETKACGNEG